MREIRWSNVTEIDTIVSAITEYRHGVSRVISRAHSPVVKCLLIKLAKRKTTWSRASNDDIYDTIDVDESRPLPLTKAE